MRALRNRYPDEVAVVFRHFPLASHALAIPAARASECVAQNGLFEAFYDTVFAQPESIGTTTWTRFAQEAGLVDTGRFAKCLNDTNSMQPVLRDQRAGQVLGVQGTPTFLINNLEVAGFPGPDSLVKYVRTAIARAHNR
jgi:protein-disulfide isomerase